MTAFAELVAATNFSFLRGASHAQEMVGQAAELGLAAIGIADRNTLAGVVRAHTAAKEHNIRLLVGARLVTTDGFEAACYPTDRAAYGRLCRLLTARQPPRHQGPVPFLLRGDARRERGADLHRPAAAADSRRLSPSGWARLLQPRAAASISAPPSPTTATSAGAWASWPSSPRRRARRSSPPTMRTITTPAASRSPTCSPASARSARSREAGYRLEANAERHLKSGAEMARLFAQYPQAVARSLEIAERITFNLEELRYEYPDEPVPPGKTPQGLSGGADLGSTPPSTIPTASPTRCSALLVKELALIARLDYARYFLTVYDVVRFAREQARSCARAAARPPTARCASASASPPSIRPEIDLLFERFISADRARAARHRRRLRARAARGGDPVSLWPLRPRARRHLLHRHPLPPAHGDPRGRQGPGPQGGRDRGPRRPDLGRSATARSPTSTSREAGLDPANPELRQAIGLARQLLGFPRHLSQHVGGFVLTRERLDETVPIHNAAMEDRTFIEWDKDDIDALGMLKVDVLALGMLTCIRKGFDLIERHYGRKPARSPPCRAEDQAVYEMLSRADSVGVFQVESRAQMSMLPRLKPRCFYDLVIEVAIVRPGPIQGDMVHPYLRRRDGHRAGRVSLRGAARRCSARRWACRCSRSRRCRSPSSRRASRPARPTSCAAPWPPSATRAPSTPSARSSSPAWSATATSASSPSAASARSRASASTASPRATRRASRCSSTSRRGSSGTTRTRSAPRILNSQPMGFYQPAQLVRDAREHGVEVRHPDVNASDWDCTLEPALSPCVPLPLAGRGSGVREPSRRNPDGAMSCFPPPLTLSPQGGEGIHRGGHAAPSASGCGWSAGWRRRRPRRRSCGARGGLSRYPRAVDAERRARQRAGAARRCRRVPLHGARPARGAVGGEGARRRRAAHRGQARHVRQAR